MTTSTNGNGGLRIPAGLVAILGTVLAGGMVGLFSWGSWMTTRTLQQQTRSEGYIGRFQQMEVDLKDVSDRVIILEHRCAQ